MKNNALYVNNKNGIISFISEEEVAIIREKGVKVMAVHSGPFHADDVISSAIAVIKFGEIIIYRISQITESNIDKFDYIVDIGKEYDGKKFFDHHQELPLYPDGVKPCGATLFASAIWDNKKEYEDIIYNRILRPVAVADNGQHKLLSTYPNLYFGWVKKMNTVWTDSFQTSNGQFVVALQMAITILKQLIDQFRSEKEAKEVIAKATKAGDGKIVILPQSMPWVEYLAKEEKPLFVMFPSPRGGYFIQCVPPSVEEEWLQRVPLPEEWKTNEPDGLIFVHKDLFCCGFKTPEQAVKALLPLC